MNIDREALTGKKLQTLHIPELDGEVHLRHITQGEAQAIADRFANPDGADAEAAGLALVHASVCNADGEPLLATPEEVAQIPLAILQRILNELGFGEEAVRGNSQTSGAECTRSLNNSEKR